ncbi:hypothetical protein QFC20_006956 [Naganishia adeliensis]|uniref:Uncharacterized protein n=1 Tax=Naganishia adeliensis TaxID=92952 RepID=A0ACC2V4W5_9TREE|nr:hypothetical protein QFC20_006956 [Naganishia adeliensis]
MHFADSCCVELKGVNGTHGRRNNNQVSTSDDASDSSIWYSGDIRIANCQRIGHWSHEHLRIEYGKQDSVVRMHVPKNSYTLGNRGVYYVLLDLEKRCWPDLRRPLPAMTFPFHFTGKQMSRLDAIAKAWRGSQAKRDVAASRTIRGEERA